MNARELAIYKRGGVAALQAEADRQLAARASRSRRTAPKRATGRAEKRAKREVREGFVAEIRARVFMRAQSRCELCGALALHMHHVIGAGLRRKREGVDTCVALCHYCHDLAHKGNLPILHDLRAWADRHGYREALAAVEKRLAKAYEARRTPSVPVLIRTEGE